MKRNNEKEYERGGQAPRNFRKGRAPEGVPGVKA